MPPSLAPASEAALVKAVIDTLAEHQAVLVADCGKGACGNCLLGALQATAILHDVPVLVDPARGADWRLYRGAALLAPSRGEAGMALRREIRNGREALTAARRLLRRYSAEAVLVKLDREGMALAEAGGEACLLPPWTSAAEDVAGAGDVMLAVLGLCRAAGVGWEPAARLAAVAAGLEAGKRGVAPVWPAEIRRALTPGDRLGAAKVVGVTDLAQLAAEYRRSGLSLVLTNGCFDLLHAGHLHCLSEASRLGDVLVVAINGSVLYATFSNGTGDCTCLDGQTVTLTYNSGAQNWVGGTVNACGGGPSVNLVCGGNGLWTIYGTYCVFYPPGQAATSCNPLSITWNNVSVSNGCSGTVTVTVTP